ncbi:hypothetical protein AMATHDRAFT_6788 [Amanita thiersii Skay4041]|uniref:Uncharacterized protein n=1 Tax=Amanita thiersii Skay4041 TaxID=703135 RepID=A0A2A9NI57_9AGAR|nr:hypothetical protein AMATHDRAFT_6788 [Amanita thiersii Skay4041]
MPFRLPSLATSATLCLILLIWLSQAVTAQGDGNGTQPGLICRPFGICEPCPENALHEPFCRPFGNRRLMHCFNASSIDQSSSSNTQHAPNIQEDTLYSTLDLEGPEQSEGETPAWESCGRIPSQERADFYEFVACNILFAAISLVVLFARSKRLQAVQARQLAARIGMVRSSGRR